MERDTTIIKRISLIEFKIESKDVIKKIGQTTGNAIVDFSDYPFKKKIISCSCPSCLSTINFGIYENGGFLSGQGKSLKIRNSWVDSLTKPEVLYLASLFGLDIKNVDNDKSYACLNVNGKSLATFGLLKECNACNENYIFFFTPFGESYKEIALRFYISEIFQVKLSNEFINKYVNFPR